MSRAPSPSLVISILALFVALGGTGYAAAKLNGKNIKNRTVSGKALRNNTLTGKQINEAKLGKVPAASTADTAGSAGSAGTAGDSAKLGGLGPEAFTKGDARVVTGNATVPTSTTQTVLEFPGTIRLKAACSGTGVTLGFIVEALTSGLSVVTEVSNNTSIVDHDANTLSAGQEFSYAVFSSQRIRVTAWRAASQSSAVQINGSSNLCKAGAVAIGQG